MPSKRCPKCRLWSSENASRCDCGYDFVSGKIEESYLVPKSASRRVKVRKNGIPWWLYLAWITGGDLTGELASMISQEINTEINWSPIRTVAWAITGLIFGNLSYILVQNKYPHINPVLVSIIVSLLGGIATLFLPIY